MEDTLNHLKFLNMLSPRGIHIPNCDKKGFYKKKQVSSVLVQCSFLSLCPPRRGKANFANPQCWPQPQLPAHDSTRG